MKQKFFFKTGLIFFLILIFYAGPVYAGLEKLAVFVDSRQQDGAAMELADVLTKDLKNRVMERGKYDARFLSSRNESRMKGEYLLHLSIIEYKVVNNSAWSVVKGGAGSASLRFHYELINTLGDEILSIDDSFKDPSSDLTQTARKVNETILSEIDPVVEAGDAGEHSTFNASKHSQGNEALQEMSEAAQPDASKKKSEGAWDTAEEIGKLEEMHNSGKISDEEYYRRSQEIMAKM